MKRLPISEKIAVLQDRCPLEFSNFVAYLKIVAEETLDDEEELQRVWGKQILSVGYWIELARQSLEPIKGFQSDSNGDNLYAEKLFSQDLSLFTNYYLSRFVGDKSNSPDFAGTVKSLFDLNLFAEA